MKILFIANRFPYPPYRGDKLKIFNLAKILSKRHDLHLVTFIQDKKDYQHIPALEKYFKTVNCVYLPKYLSALKCLIKIFSRKPYQILYFESSGMRKLLDQIINRTSFDVIHTQHLRMAQYSAHLKQYPRILDLPDAYSLYWSRRAKLSGNFLMKWFNYYEYKKVTKYENMIKEFDLNLVCSDEDKEVLLHEHGQIPVEILPNGVDLKAFRTNGHDYSIKDKIIFTGNMDYFPNVDAAVYFVKELLPELLKKYPNLKFYIAGQNPVKKVKQLASEHVIVTGFIKDLNQFYGTCTLAVSPIRYGAGTLNKVLEPMALGIPVVSTIIGFKGLGVESGQGVILAEDKMTFINAICRLLDNQALREEVGSKGKEVVFSRYGWNDVAAMLESYFRTIK